MGRRVVIGVTGPGHGIPWAWWATRWQLRRCGAEPVRLNAQSGYPGEEFSGFVVGGGNDIDPAIYGGDVSAAPNVDALRDEFELAVLELAERTGVPVLGICRGAQLLNVFRGGKLYSDIRHLRVLTSNRGTLLPRKHVEISAGSKLAGLIGAESSRVNSLHHQAVSKTGRNLEVSARDRDNLVQAIESSRGPLRIGVQWHPEYLPQCADQRRLFAGFVEACRQRE